MPPRKVPVRQNDVETWKREIVKQLVSLLGALSDTLNERQDAFTLRELTRLNEDVTKPIAVFVRAIEGRLDNV